MGVLTSLMAELFYPPRSRRSRTNTTWQDLAKAGNAEVSSQAGPEKPAPAQATPLSAAGETNPGDEAEPGTPGTGEAVCPICNGTGAVAGARCENCSGSGKIIQGIGGG